MLDIRPLSILVIQQITKIITIIEQVAGELTADYLIKQFEKDLLEEGSDVDGPDELKASNGVDTQDSRSGSSGHSSPSKPRTLIETYRAASGDDPEILDCESSIGSDIRTIDCGDSSDQDDGNENYNNSNRYYNHNQLPDLGFDGQLLASMQSASSSADDNDLIRFLTAHGGRLRGLYHNSHVPATTTITEPSEYEYDYDDLHVHDVIDGFITIFWYLTVIYLDKMMRIPSSVATMLCLFKLVHMREKSWSIHHHHHIDQ